MKLANGVKNYMKSNSATAFFIQSLKQRSVWKTSGICLQTLQLWLKLRSWNYGRSVFKTVTVPRTGNVYRGCTFERLKSMRSMDDVGFGRVAFDQREWF
jgi:hypothetical protein